ncbi:MAG: hypothetical protein RMH84_01025 [Sulfolobales archaeon]|nr:hypothetical protein [Sulfolobales archaeon]MDW8010168.1 hypothetical protein [Sulfolobales archaeon]
MRSAYTWLRIVEVTAIPISALLALYVLSGYGMVSPGVTSVLGFTYRFSTYVHSHPVLRYLTTVLVAAHGCGGFMLLVSRYVRKPILKHALSAAALVYAVVLLTVSTLVELALMLGMPR